MGNERDLLERIAALEAELNNVHKWNEKRDEDLNKIEDRFNNKVDKLDEKIDKIIDNEKQLIETINDSGTSLDDKMDEKFNKLQIWLLGAITTAGVGLLMFVLELLKK